MVWGKMWAPLAWWEGRQPSEVCGRFQSILQGEGSGFHVKLPECALLVAAWFQVLAGLDGLTQDRPIELGGSDQVSPGTISSFT